MIQVTRATSHPSEGRKKARRCALDHNIREEGLWNETGSIRPYPNHHLEDSFMFNRLRALLIVCLFAFGSIGLAACGSNACEDAADKMAECTGNSSISADGECSGEAECIAGCINSASCDELKDMFNPTGPVAQCSAKCTGS